jgi:hypothetical protein
MSDAWLNARTNHPIDADQITARAAEENRRLVADELAAAVGQNRRATDQARQVLLVVAGRGTSAPAAVWPDASADLGIAGAERLAH